MGPKVMDKSRSFEKFMKGREKSRNVQKIQSCKTSFLDSLWFLELPRKAEFHPNYRKFVMSWNLDTLLTIQ